MKRIAGKKSVGRMKKKREPVIAEGNPPVLPPSPSGSTVPQVMLKPHEDRRVRRGHAWVFSNEIALGLPDIEPGSVVRFLTGRGDLLGTGFYHPHSLIAGRLLDRGDVVLDAAFFERRLRTAHDLRRALFTDDAWRWVHGESDDLPGLVVDRYGDVVVIESYCAGMDLLLGPLTEAVKAFGPWQAIVLKSDAALRRLEGLSDRVETLEGTVSRPHDFSVDGVRLAADLLEGQKTGYFFDQRMNRRLVAGMAKGKTVLDLFCHTGAFGLSAAVAGAERVLGVDESEAALALARRGADENNVSASVRFERKDAFEFLHSCPETFDIVVVDPPRFASSKKVLPQAVEAYIRLNALALRRVSGSGVLATSSCSQHLDRETFRQIISRAAHLAGRRARILSWGGAAPDHPVRPAMPETEYLKFALIHVT